MGLIDDEAIHEGCLMQIENLNLQLQSAHQDVTNISLEKNRIESELNSLRMEITSLRNNSHSKVTRYFIKIIFSQV